MNMDKKYIVIGGIVAVVILFFITASNASNHEKLAQCLNEKGVKFYGAYWCPHCKEQKEAFGSGAKSLPYIECAIINSDESAKVCRDANITSYPTWIFSDGTRKTGNVPLDELAEKANCPVS